MSQEGVHDPLPWFGINHLFGEYGIDAREGDDLNKLLEIACRHDRVGPVVRYGRIESFEGELFLKASIDLFDDLGSKSKPLFQGNDDRIDVSLLCSGDQRIKA